MARLDRVNARLAARRASRPGPAGLAALWAQPGLASRLAWLRASPAGAALGGAETAGEAQAALAARADRERRALLAEVEGARPRRLLRALLALDEAEVVKAVARGVARGAAAEEVIAACPGEADLPAGAIRRAAAAADVAAALAALAAEGSAIARAAAAALPPDARLGLLALELAADRAALARAGAACGRGEDAAVLRRHLEDRVDARNAGTLLALAGAAPVADPWLDGGRRLPPPALARAAAEGPAAAWAAAARAFPALGPARRPPWEVEEVLEGAVLRELRRAARRHPLSLAVALRHLAEERAERRAIAVALRAAEPAPAAGRLAPWGEVT